MDSKQSKSVCQCFIWLLYNYCILAYLPWIVGWICIELKSWCKMRILSRFLDRKAWLNLYIISMVQRKKQNWFQFAFWVWLICAWQEWRKLFLDILANSHWIWILAKLEIILFLFQRRYSIWLYKRFWSKSARC